MVIIIMANLSLLLKLGMLARDSWVLDMIWVSDLENLFSLTCKNWTHPNYNTHKFAIISPFMTSNQSDP